MSIHYLKLKIQNHYGKNRDKHNLRIKLLLFVDMNVIIYTPYSFLFQKIYKYKTIGLNIFILYK